jgi:hypothetical protein
MYSGINNDGMGLLKNLISRFSDKEYKFMKLIDVYSLSSGENQL